MATSELTASESSNNPHSFGDLLLRAVVFLIALTVNDNVAPFININGRTLARMIESNQCKVLSSLNSLYS